MTSERAGFPTATARQYRIRLFQPTRRPVELEEAKFSTQWGDAWVTGKLGQQHADVLDAMMFEHIARAPMPDGRIKLLVDPFKVRRRACLSSYGELKKIVTQLMKAVIKLDLPATEKARLIQCEGHIIDHRDEAMKSTGAKVTRPNPIGKARRHPREKDNEERPLWRVELGKAFVQLIEGDVWLGYDPAPIAALKHGVSQALVRHVKTHSRVPAGGWHLDGLIETVCGIRPGAVRDRRREIREDRDMLARMGINLDGNRVTVEQSSGRVEQSSGRVEQNSGVWSKTPDAAGFSGYSEAPAEGAAP